MAHEQQHRGALSRVKAHPKEVTASELRHKRELWILKLGFWRQPYHHFIRVHIRQEWRAQPPVSTRARPALGYWSSTIWFIKAPHLQLTTSEMWEPAICHRREPANKLKSFTNTLRWIPAYNRTGKENFLLSVCHTVVLQRGVKCWHRDWRNQRERDHSSEQNWAIDDSDSSFSRMNYTRRLQGISISTRQSSSPARVSGGMTTRILPEQGLERRSHHIGA